ncbi:MAG: 30S ribosomal protein S1 [Candidatus Parcubacteria bacterium]|nr:MAG: 30S ribosomal protein S1 [Candidatus Parcubacteria bacterium]
MTEVKQANNNIKLKLAKPLEIDSILQGTVMSKKRNEIIIDLSPYGTGRLYGIYYLQCKNLAQQLKVGDKVGVKIIGLSDDYGNYEVILQEISNIDKWQKILTHYQKNDLLEIEIKDANRGGWLGEVEGMPCFIPLSQMSPEYYPRINEKNDKNAILEHLKKFIGQKIKCRIVSAELKQNKLILSEKAAKEELYQEVFKKMIIGDIMKVRIVSISNFGLFVRFNDNPAMDGLIHASEIPEEQLANLEKNFKIGMEIEAKLIQIKNNRANFSLKNLTIDPWVQILKKYKEGDKVSGVVKSKNDIFGVVEVNGAKGLIFENLNKLEVDKTYDFIIEKLKNEDKSLILKLANEL